MIPGLNGNLGDVERNGSLELPAGWCVLAILWDWVTHIVLATVPSLQYNEFATKRCPEGRAARV